MGPKEQHDREFPGISIGLLCPRLSNREADNLDTPMGTNKQKEPQRQAPLFSQKTSEKTASQD